MKIVFCHNVYVRYQTLFETIKIEKQLYPDSISIVAFNDEPPPDYMKQFNDVVFVPFKGKTHKIGCANGCIVSIKEAIKYQPDVIIFSHDDVSISIEHQRVFEYNLKVILDQGNDVVCRIPGSELYGKNYYMMECFFLSLKGAKQCFENTELFLDENDIQRDIRGSISPEVFLHDILNQDGVKVKVLEYDHKLEGYNNTLGAFMGFTHKNAGLRGWED